MHFHYLGKEAIAEQKMSVTDIDPVQAWRNQFKGGEHNEIHILFAYYRKARGIVGKRGTTESHENTRLSKVYM